MPTTSETTTTSTTSTTDPEFEVLQAFDEFFAAVEEYEEEHWEDHEAAKAKEVAPSAWAGDLQAHAAVSTWKAWTSYTKKFPSTT